MNPILIAVIVVSFLAVSGIAVMLFKTVPISKRVYREQLVRTSPDKWMRTCSAPENEEQLAMFNEGMEWAKANAEHKREVEIDSCGLHLYGEFYDFGSDKCVFIAPGRCETLCYSYYFAKPYADAGYSVLVTDPRGHGKSDGEYNTVGGMESKDIKNWVRFAEKNLGIKSFYIHSICVGSAGSIIALTDKDCPESLHGLVADGCYTTFPETFKNHMKELKRPVFPVLQLVMAQIKIHTGTNVYKTAPIRLLKKYNKRILFLYGEQDIYSLPEKSKQLYAKCASPDKQIVWFKEGCHSHLRINNREQYDEAIKTFLAGEK